MIFSSEWTFLDVGLTILCDEDGRFQIEHWPPLPIDDCVEILQIFKVNTFGRECARVRKEEEF